VLQVTMQGYPELGRYSNFLVL